MSIKQPTRGQSYAAPCQRQDSIRTQEVHGGPDPLLNIRASKNACQRQAVTAREGYGNLAAATVHTNTLGANAVISSENIISEIHRKAKVRQSIFTGKENSSENSPEKENYY